MDVGRGDRIRTCDPLLPKQMRYQTALLPDDGCHLEVIIPLANPPGLAALDDHRDWHVGDMPQANGGPGRTRTCNLAVMSGRLYR